MYDIFANILNDFNDFCKKADEFIEKQKEYENFKTLICEVLRGSAFSSKPFLTPLDELTLVAHTGALLLSWFLSLWGPVGAVLNRFSRFQLFVTLWTVCSPPGSSVHAIVQARILEWAAISSSRGSSRPRD